ncbi:MAG: hypothetical protein RLP44_14880 [Aggregatilineales bacterium]
MKKLKVAIFSRRCDEPHCAEPPQRMEYYFQMLEGATQQAQKNSCDLLILPGHSLGKQPDFFPNPIEEIVNKGLSLLQSLAQKYGLTLLGEVDGTYWFYPDGEISNKMNQQMAFSNDPIEEKQLFLNEFDSDQRTIKIRDRKIKTMLCGENNVMTVHRDGQFSLPNELEWNWDYDVIVNPTHDSATRPELWKRYSYWSKEGRTIIHTTNNFRQTTWNTAIRIYYDGNMVAADGNNAETVIDEGRWRLIIHSIR